MDDQSSTTHSFFYQNFSIDERREYVKTLKSNEDWAQAVLLGDEWANCLTHSFGLILSIIGFIFLIHYPLQENDYWKLLNFSVYGTSLILLYAASSCYHGLPISNLKKVFQTLDHCAIYLLIAGSYTPFTMLALGGIWGWVLFGIVWSFAGVGIILKTFFRHRFKIISMSLYLLMGWLIVIAAEPLVERLHPLGLNWLIAGGIFYTGGVIFYVLDKRRFFHAIWHLFVLTGSVCHYFAILLYL